MIMKQIAFIIAILILVQLITGCAEADKTSYSKDLEANQHELELENLLNKLSERNRVDSFALDLSMSELGMERLIGITETSNFIDSNNQKVQEIRLKNRVFQKGDYIYIDFILDNDIFFEEALIHVQYDQVDVYKLGEFHSAKIIENDGIFTINSNNDNEIWFGYVVRMRNKVDQAAITYSITLDIADSSYFWNNSLVSNYR